MTAPLWLRRLELGSLRRHHVVFLAMVVAALSVTAVVSAGTVIWASTMVSSGSDRIVALQTANKDILQDATEAYFGLHRVGTLQPAEELAGYEAAVLHLPSDQRRLRSLAEGEPRLRKAISRQDAALRAWLQQYAGPLSEAADRGPGEGPMAGPMDGPMKDPMKDPVEFAELGQDLFNAIREANRVVSQKIQTPTWAAQPAAPSFADDSRARTRSILLGALVLVTVLPLVAVGGIALLGRRLSRAVVVPLDGITGVLAQLRSGQVDARARLTGPEEVRQIAAGLNLLTEENLRASEVEADVLLQLQSIDRVRTDLVSTVSHELRTPLASIKGYLELLQDDLADHMTPQQTSMMNAIRRNLDRLNELIANLLALSRAEETALVVQPVDLRAIATEVGTDIRLTAAGRDVGVRILHSAEAVLVLGDRSQLIRAVQNLVTNAVKFSRPGGTVELRVSQQGDQAVLEVADEGIGIPAEDLPGLGSRFYRASNAVQAEIAGTGLGLRIVQTILGRHGGHLSVDSVEGEGSTFTISIPAGGAAVADEHAEIAEAADRSDDVVPEPA